MKRGFLKKITSSKNNNSAVYLALLCLLYLIFTSNYLPFSSAHENLTFKDVIYVEVSKDGFSTVKSFYDPSALKELSNQFSLSINLESGDRIIVDEHGASVAKMSGLKRISLGIPIGINSATSKDLEAIPGIGPELAYRIISARESKGNFKSIDELDSIDGIGNKKLETIKNLTNLD